MNDPISYLARAILALGYSVSADAQIHRGEVWWRARAVFAGQPWASLEYRLQVDAWCDLASQLGAPTVDLSLRVVRVYQGEPELGLSVELCERLITIGQALAHGKIAAVCEAWARSRWPEPCAEECIDFADNLRDVAEAPTLLDLCCAVDGLITWGELSEDPREGTEGQADAALCAALDSSPAAL